MSKVEKELTDSEILEWATKDLVICETGRGLHQSRSGVEPRTPKGIADYGTIIQASRTSDRYSIQGQFGINITRYANNGTRKIGYISGVNSDGSFQLYLLGNGSISLQPTHAVETNPFLEMNGELRILPPSMDHYLPEHASDFGEYQWGSTGNKIKGVIGYSSSGNISVGDSFMYNPEWIKISQTETAASIAYCAKKGNDYIIDNAAHINVELTNDIATTVKLGVPLECYFWQRSQGGWYYGDKNIGGDLYDLFNSMSINICSSVANMPTSVAFSEVEIQGATSTYTLHQLNTYQPFNGQMAYEYTPYNLILTYNLDEAKRYVETGELPSDAFLYPFDVDNIPVNTDGGTDAGDSDGTQGTVDTGDTTWEDTDDQSPSAPGQNGQSLTNNNLYWLTSQQLKNFLDWFWDEATDVTDPSELFEKIQGLYENLSEAIVAVRYMPVRPEWIGGVSTDTKIIVGMLEKAEQCRVINKVVPDIQTIGSIDIRELAKDNKTWDGFLNYSPYCQMSLYLPFHGFIDLDADLIMNSKLTIKAAYDILTGTIQYFIYRTARGADNLNLVNTVVAKMATDIPISLQTKTQRDSAIFQNVSSAAGNLIGAGASLATGNPIGMVMSTANIAATQPTGAPLTLKGTISENGAYYDSALCAIYVKRPGINIPSNYDRKVGNPCNVAMKLSSVHGFVKCENPFISFSEVTSDNSLGFPPPKPTKDEIDTIYNALSEGVILP